MGRPRKYSSPEQFDAVVDQYITTTKEAEEPITWTGLALALGFSSRQGIDGYLEFPEFVDSVKRAKQLVESAYERRLSANNPTGAIFALKNMGWSDRQEVQHSGEVTARLPDDQLDAAIAAAIARATGSTPGR